MPKAGHNWASIGHCMVSGWMVSVHRDKLPSALEMWLCHVFAPSKIPNQKKDGGKNIMLILSVGVCMRACVRAHLRLCCACPELGEPNNTYATFIATVVFITPDWYYLFISVGRGGVGGHWRRRLLVRLHFIWGLNGWLEINSRLKPGCAFLIPRLLWSVYCVRKCSACYLKSFCFIQHFIYVFLIDWQEWLKCKLVCQMKDTATSCWSSPVHKELKIKGVFSP